VVTRLNRFLCSIEAETTATVLVSVWEPGTRTWVRANAGHPPPLRCRPGEFGYLTPPAGSRLLGVHAEHRYVEELKTLRPGTTVVCFTDGLIEDRSTPINLVMGEVLEEVTTLGDLAPSNVVEHLVAWRRHRPDREDDMCLLAFRVAGPESHPAAKPRSYRQRLRLIWP
jgi:serine phosphatase RsbU (regulator of sigma subunit)